MNTITLGLPEVLWITALVLGIYALEIVVLMRSVRFRDVLQWRRKQKLHSRHSEMRALQDELDLLKIRFDAFVNQSQTNNSVIPVLSHTVTSYLPHQYNTANIVSADYSKAFSLADKGLSLNEIAAQCDITKGEAELILALQKNNAGKHSD